MSSDAVSLPPTYGEMLARLKEQVRSAQLQAQRSVNTQLIELYWMIGNEILRQQEQQAWGSGVVGRLADLRCWNTYSVNAKADTVAEYSFY